MLTTASWNSPRLVSISARSGPSTSYESRAAPASASFSRACRVLAAIRLYMLIAIPKGLFLVQVGIQSFCLVRQKVTIPICRKVGDARNVIQTESARYCLEDLTVRSCADWEWWAVLDMRQEWERHLTSGERTVVIVGLKEIAEWKRLKRMRAASYSVFRTSSAMEAACNCKENVTKPNLVIRHFWQSFAIF